jgi:gag-polyprotein putative aspartyl protease
MMHLRPTISAFAAALLMVHGDRAGAVGREIPLVRDGGVYRVPVTLDGRLVRLFIVDSGASEVQLSTDVLGVLFPRGSAPPVPLPSRTYRLGDGRMVRNRRVLIPRLRVGNREFRQVAATIEGAGAPLLLGQNVLGRLGAWSIDNRRGALVFGERRGEPSSAECANWRAAPDECEVAVVRDYLRSVRPPHEVTKLTLLRSRGAYASVLVDAVRKSGDTRARLCGPMDLRLAETGWRVFGASGLREVGPADRCPP